jgi:hypothetical protein
MPTKENKENRNKKNEELRQEFTVLDDKRPLAEAERKYDILKQLRIKLGKTKEEFQKIFDLYTNLHSQKNT